MAEPSWAETWTQIANLGRLWQETHNFSNTDTPNWLDMEDTFMQAIEMHSTEAQGALAGVARMRSYLSAIISPAAIQEVLTPYILTLGRVINAPGRDVQTLIDDIYDYMITNSLSVNARGIVRGAVTMGGGNTGNGTVRRVVRDRDAQPIEAGFADVVNLICVLDGNTGTNQGQEIFRIYGQTFGSDFIDMASGAGYGSGLDEQVEAATVDRGELLNPTFNAFQGTAAAPTSITNWTVSGAAATLAGRVNLSSTVYRTAAMEGTTPRALECLQSVRVEQAFLDGNRKLSPDVAYHYQVAYRSTSSGSGSIRLRVGLSSATAVFTAGTTTYTVLALGSGAAWEHTSFTSGLGVRLDVTLNAGRLLVDDVLAVAMRRYDGYWIAVVGGATPFRFDDTATFTDTTGTGILQNLFWRGFGRYLPSNNAGAETIADPA